MWFIPLFPEQASTIASKVDALFIGLLAVSAFFSILICFLIVYLAVRYRAGSKASRAGAVDHNVKLELAWMIVPFTISMGLFTWAAILYFEMYNAPGDSFEVAVVAKQWMWKLQHPEGKREINELHVPLGRAVRLKMISQDVIHSFFVPAFRIKQDVLPGRYTSAWFRPTMTGRFHLYCAEYCGTNHSTMGGWIVVMEPADYEEWLTRDNDNATMAASGARLFEQYHCSGCHGPNATVRAPRLEGVYGGAVPIADGKSFRFITADDRYVRDSILLPKQEVVAGFEPIMPSFQGQIPEDDLLQIIAYIKSIGRKGATTP